MIRLIPTKKNNEIRKKIAENIDVKNAYQGKRCFVLANGPSINEENLEHLNGEYVITVNQMIRKPEFVNLAPIANIWADPAYFDENMPEESKKEFSNLFERSCKVTNSILNFVPINARSFIMNRGLEVEGVRYFDPALSFYNGYSKSISFDKMMPGFQNIVQYAIVLAIYMGFKEIYILGCDSTGIITKINSVLGEEIEDCYTYDLGKKGQNYVNSLLDYFTIEEQFAGWTKTFQLYEELNKYCVDNGIILANCSKRTIIQSIPRRSMESVLHSK